MGFNIIQVSGMRIFTVLLLVSILCNSCYTSRVYNKDVRVISRAIVKQIYKGDFFHEQEGVLQYQPSDIVVDTSRDTKSRFYIVYRGKNRIRVEKQSWKEVKVKVRCKRGFFFETRNKNKETKLLEEIGRYIGH